MADITVHDLAAMGDVLDQLIEGSDQLDFEQALTFKNMAIIVQGKLKTLLGLLETQQLSLLDGQPKVVDGTIFAKKSTGKWRRDSGKLRSRVFFYVTHDLDTGEKVKGLTIAKAVDKAIDIMSELFVAPADLPKRGALEKLKIEMPDICEWETTGSKLVEMKLEDDHG